LNTDNVVHFAQAQETTNQTENPFKMLDDSNTIPVNREMILIDEMNAIKDDINTIKNT
jgi:hypothetical protein